MSVKLKAKPYDGDFFWVAHVRSPGVPGLAGLYRNSRMFQPSNGTVHLSPEPRSQTLWGGVFYTETESMDRARRALRRR